MILFQAKISADDRVDRGSLRLIDDYCNLLRMAFLKALESNRHATFKIVLEREEK